MVSGALTATSPTTSEMAASVFNGTTDYVEIPHNSAQLGANLKQGFTISAWINARSIGETAGVIVNKSNGTAGNNGFSWYMTANRVTFVLNNGATKSNGAGSITYGTWYRVLVTISSAHLCNHYVNGALSGTANQDVTNAISTIDTTNVMRIGNRSQATDRTFDGSIKSVKMWNRVLTTAEIAADYAGQDPNRSHLIHEFKLEKDYADTGRIGVTATNSGSYFNVTNKNAIIEDVRRLNLAAVTDKLKIIPQTFGGKFVVVGINRTA